MMQNTKAGYKKKRDGLQPTIKERLPSLKGTEKGVFGGQSTGSQHGMQVWGIKNYLP